MGILRSAIGKLEELCNISDDNDNEVDIENTIEVKQEDGRGASLEELYNIPDDNKVELASEEVSHVSRDEFEQETKREELMKVIYEKEKRMMDEILETSSCNSEEEAFSNQLQLVIKDSISKYFQSLSSGGESSSSSSEEGQCSGLKLSLPWRLQLRNNWHQSKGKPIIEDLKPARSDRLEIELPMMVGCYQYHLLINGVAFCDRGRPYRHDDEDFGDFVNFFSLWSEAPLPAWPGLRMTTKLDFPFKVELTGSWGEQVAECMMNPDGFLVAHLPSLRPGVYHYNFLINGQQFCDKSRSYQQYFFGCYNLLKLSNSGIVELNYTLGKPSPTDSTQTPFPEELVSSCISILELLDQQFKEWEHPSRLSDRFKLSEDEEQAAKMCPEFKEPKDEEAAKMLPRDEKAEDEEDAAKMWPNKDEEDEGYDTIRKRGKSQKVAKNCEGSSQNSCCAGTIFLSCFQLRST